MAKKNKVLQNWPGHSPEMLNNIHAYNRMKVEACMMKQKNVGWHSRLNSMLLLCFHQEIIGFLVKSNWFCSGSSIGPYWTVDVQHELSRPNLLILQSIILCMKYIICGISTLRSVDDKSFVLLKFDLSVFLDIWIFYQLYNFYTNVKCYSGEDYLSFELLFEQID